VKVEFLTPLRTEKLEDDFWVVFMPFSARVGDRTITVPAGYVTDFASVPRLPLAYLLAGNTAHKSAVLHDYLYARGRGRKFADKVFLGAMEAEGIPGWRRRLMYAAVRLFGRGAYTRVRACCRRMEGVKGS
jgi:hypothetical protein